MELVFSSVVEFCAEVKLGSAAADGESRIVEGGVGYASYRNLW